MNIRPSEAEGATLDWLVALCQGLRGVVEDGAIARSYRPSTDWSQGGPIIEQEKITVLRYGDKFSDKWEAFINEDGCIDFYPGDLWQGATPLVAAMRCYVASKLGNEIRLPDKSI